VIDDGTGDRLSGWQWKWTAAESWKDNNPGNSPW